MRRTAVTSLAVLALLATAAAAARAAPPRGPKTLRPARGSDFAPRPGQWSEWWLLRATPRAGGGSLVLRVRRLHERTEARLNVSTGHGRWADLLVDGDRPSGSATRLALRSGSAALTLRRGAHRLRAALASDGGSAALRLTHARRGPAALGWRLGSASWPGAGAGAITLAWTVPIADARLEATIRPTGAAPIHTRGWHATLEHGWGRLRFSEAYGQWRYWEQHVVHAPHGVTWLLHGLDPARTLVGPGARDAQWLGVLARVDRRGVRVCRARIDRRGWLYPLLLESDMAPRIARARCGGMAATFRDRGRLGIGEEDGVWETRSRTRAHGGAGLAFHLTPDFE